MRYLARLSPIWNRSRWATASKQNYFLKLFSVCWAQCLRAAWFIVSAPLLGKFLIFFCGAKNASYAHFQPDVFAVGPVLFEQIVAEGAKRFDRDRRLVCRQKEAKVSGEIEQILYNCKHHKFIFYILDCR